MTQKRILTWDGCKNIRDLGGMHTPNGRTRWGAVVRGDHPANLTKDGWSALYSHGIRTVISLRTHGLPNDHPEVVAPYPDIAVVSIAIEDVTDEEFAEKWASSDLWCTPLYYPDALNRWPQRHTEAIQAIAQAQPGGVFFHCKRGHDRTGIISLLLLSLVGVSADDIIADYELSIDPDREELLAQQQTTTRAVLLSTMAALDTESYLRAGGLSQSNMNALYSRFLENKE